MTPTTVPDRIVALDGVRGLMTVFVLASHFFGEVEHGLDVFKIGWLAVDMFFVMSGFLIGRLILDKKDCSNFFAVFYIRRFCRTVPSYLIVVTITVLMFMLAGGHHWMEIDRTVPFWSYFVFVQNFYMAHTASIGSHWLAPTWTLALEEHFYLVAPAFLIFCPARFVVPSLYTLIAGSIAFKMLIIGGWIGLPQGYVYSTLPGRADTILTGLLLACYVKRGSIDWARHQLLFRMTPLLALGAVAALRFTGMPVLVESLTHFTASIGCAAFLLMMVMHAPEAESCKAKWLCWWGDNSYSIYLTHLPVLGLCHGLILGRVADINDAKGILVTLLALPITLLVANVLTRTVEHPLSAYGRSWAWKKPASDATSAAQPVT